MAFCVFRRRPRTVLISFLSTFKVFFLELWPIYITQSLTFWGGEIGKNVPLSHVRQRDPGRWTGTGNLQKSDVRDRGQIGPENERLLDFKGKKYFLRLQADTTAWTDP